MLPESGIRKPAYIGKCMVSLYGIPLMSECYYLLIIQDGRLIMADSPHLCVQSQSSGYQRFREGTFFVNGVTVCNNQEGNHTPSAKPTFELVYVGS